jgi:hypothetical protein
MSIGDLRIKIRHGDRVETATGRCESRRRPLAVPVGQEADDEADDLRREVAKGAHGGRDAERRIGSNGRGSSGKG